MNSFLMDKVIKNFMSCCGLNDILNLLYMMKDKKKGKYQCIREYFR
ncbi:MAG: hypothetical protein K0R92_2600 [Lachnospiraceae bacterium]|jgi:hypothetical protein|nr:hypothetical protein [Lachnospiraceae bacterium]MDF2844668.1 hypothetical protein [Herbinix sp.]